VAPSRRTEAAPTGPSLELLTAAREAEGAGSSADGRWSMKLTPVDPPRSAICVTDEGRLVLADALVEFTA